MIQTWKKNSEAGYPPPGTCCWLYIPQRNAIFPAYHHKLSANGWSNEDTWEDFNNEVTHYQVIEEPKPPEKD